VFDAAPFGVIGLESAFPLLHARFVDAGRWDIDFLVEKMTVKPAKVMGAPWGTLDKGASADFALIKVGEKYRFEERHLRSKSANCPWLGEEFSARIAATFFAGECVFANPDVFPNGLAAKPGAEAKKKSTGAKK